MEDEKSVKNRFVSSANIAWRSEELGRWLTYNEKKKQKNNGSSIEPYGTPEKMFWVSY